MALLLVVAGSADAAVIRKISDTSTGTSTASWLIDVFHLNVNDANMTNTVTSTGNSGGNAVVSADDQSGTSVTTGDSAAVSGIEGSATPTSTYPGNVANTNVTSEELETPDGADNTIEEVSDDSDATTTSSDEVDNTLINNNEVLVTNDVDGTSNSGTNAVASGDSLTGTTVATGTTASASFMSQDFNFNMKTVKRTIVQRAP